MKELFKNKPQKVVFWAGFFVVLLLTVVGVSTKFLYKEVQEKNDPDVIAVVGGEKIRKADFNKRVFGTNLIGTPSEPVETNDKEKEAFLNELVEDKIIALEAKKNNVTISETELMEKTKAEVPDYTTLGAAEKDAIFANRKSYFLKEAFKEKAEKKYWGDYVLFRFDKYYQMGEKDLPGEGDQAKIEEQKKYAEKLANEVSAKLTSGAITFEQAKEIVNNDNSISLKAFAPQTPNIHGTFADFEYSDRLMYFDSNSYSGFLENVTKLKAEETSKPFMVSGYPSDARKGDMSPIFYAIVKVNKVTGGEIDLGSMTYEQWLEQKKKEYKVELFFSNLSDKLKDVKYSNSSIINEAKAAESITCTVAFSGTHYTAYNVWAYYLGTDNLYHAFSNARVKIEAGNGEETDLKGSNADCSNIDQYSYHEATRYAYNSGRMYSAWLGSTDEGWSKAHVANCGSTSTGAISIYDDDSISGSVAGLGTWQFITSNFDAYGISGQDYDSKWLNGTPTVNASYAYIKLDMGTSSSWANGTTITKRAIFKPHWNTKPRITHSSPAHNGTPIDIPVGSTTAPVRFTLRGDDSNNDSITMRVAYQKQNADGTWPGGWSYSSYIETGTNFSQRYDYTDLLPDGVVRGTEVINLPAGHYKWRVYARDEHGLFSEKDVDGIIGYDWGGYGDSLGLTDWEFTVQDPLPQSLSCAVVPQTGSVPFKVTVNVTPTNVPGVNADTLYMFNMGDGISTGIQRKSGFNYTYNSAGNYTITANYNSLSATCSPQAAATDPRGGTGGEVAP